MKSGIDQNRLSDLRINQTNNLNTMKSMIMKNCAQPFFKTPFRKDARAGIYITCRAGMEPFAKSFEQPRPYIYSILPKGFLKSIERFSSSSLG